MSLEAPQPHFRLEELGLKITETGRISSQKLGVECTHFAWDATDMAKAPYYSDTAHASTEGDQWEAGTARNLCQDLSWLPSCCPLPGRCPFPPKKMAGGAGPSPRKPSLSGSWSTLSQLTHSSGQGTLLGHGCSRER